MWRGCQQIAAKTLPQGTTENKGYFTAFYDGEKKGFTVKEIDFTVARRLLYRGQQKTKL